MLGELLEDSRPMQQLDNLLDCSEQNTLPQLKCRNAIFERCVGNIILHKFSRQPERFGVEMRIVESLCCFSMDIVAEIERSAGEPASLCSEVLKPIMDRIIARNDW